jgi:hypothetical protein
MGATGKYYVYGVLGAGILGWSERQENGVTVPLWCMPRRPCPAI